MVWTTCILLGRSGFYIASHPWLHKAGFVKVGFSASLETRLHMASFKTCFTPEWEFAALFECESHKEALILEQSVLYCMSTKRVPHRELISASPDEVIKIARAVIKQLNLTVIEVDPASVQQDSHDVEEDAHDLIEKQSPSLADGSHPLSTSSTAIEPLQLSVTPYIEELDRIVAAEITPYSTQPDSSSLPVPFESDDLLDESIVDFLTVGFPPIDVESYELQTLRPYQTLAVQSIQKELDVCGQTICQMACRCGKTPVAYHVMSDVLAKSNGRVLYLVPGLSLLRQTARKLHGYGLPKTVLILLIGSDPNSVELSDGTLLSMTTDEATIRDVVLSSNTGLLVLSTYHSSPLLATLNIFSLTVFDECHRVCGSVDQTAFNTILYLPRQGQRLFLTATPTYDTPLRMNNRELFGGIGYRYYLREGIDAGYVNRFSVRVILGSNLDDMNSYLYEAMTLVNKMLVFCRNIKHAESLSKCLKESPRPPGVDDFVILVAHSRMGYAEVSAVLQQFMSTPRCLLFNVRLFQEGVEIPDLNAVFFAAPRYSSRDIIQSICRPLNILPNKPGSFVFLPAAMNTRYAAKHPINLKNFSTLIPFTDALMDEDPTLFEYMIDPDKKQYDFNVVGLRSLKLSTEKIETFILPAVRRGVRYSTQNTDRLHRAARLPWKQVFGEMKRVVEECNRYPKTNDAWVVGETSISLSLFYRYARRGYDLYQKGEQSYLQIHQIRDLEGLPQWRKYGLEGPYPWQECLKTLETHLAKYGSVPPLEVHKGGYIGLDATPFERLSGFLMQVNQSDGREHLRLAPEKQKELDVLCSKYGLVWRKRRTKSGKVAKNSATFITESFNQFKRLAQARHKLPAFQRYLQVHYPGYPEKHERMETMQNLQDGKVPPRHQVKKRTRRSRNKETKKSKQRKTVMCRVCRIHVDTAEYAKHMASKAHMRALHGLGNGS